MIALLQRVSEASVRANGQIVGSINAGLLVFLCAERGDRQEPALKLFNDFVNLTRSKYSTSLASIETGIFGADMKVSLINDGPVTFWLQHPVRGANS